jgi:hypothetical protein
MDRERALALGVYTDQQTEGSADWDVFVRFLMAGYAAAHVPEVVYSWRAHAGSTADDAATKPYIHLSQKSVLQRFLDAETERDKFAVEYSPLLGGAAHWHLVRKHAAPRPFRTVLIEGDENASSLLDVANEMERASGFIGLIGRDVAVAAEGWEWDALGIFELQPDAVMAGGRIWNSQGIITEAGRQFGFRGLCGCPERGRRADDAGYFAQMWKQRCVSAVASQFAVIRADFLLDLLHAIPREATAAGLGMWAGARAMELNKRVVYTPFLSGMSDVDWDSRIAATELEVFKRLHSDLIPDRRFYPRRLSLSTPYALGNAEAADFA